MAGEALVHGFSHNCCRFQSATFRHAMLFTRLKNTLRLHSHRLRNLLSLADLVSTTAWVDMCFPKAMQGRRVSLQSGALKLVGDFHEPSAAEPVPAVLLLHGTSIQGRKLPLIQILALELHRLGYAVLALDARGYGESEDPPTLIGPEDFDFTQDIRVAVSFLAAQPHVDLERLYILGHSFGAGIALPAAVKDKRIKKLALFGPPRRMSERFLVPDAPGRDFIVARTQNDMGLPYSPDFSILKKVLEQRNIESYVDWLSKPGHVPILLIDAEKENEKDLEFLRGIYQQLTHPVNYWTVPNANHYLNTGKIFGRLSYSRPMVQGFVKCVDRWFNEHHPVLTSR